MLEVRNVNKIFAKNTKCVIMYNFGITVDVTTNQRWTIVNFVNRKIKIMRNNQFLIIFIFLFTKFFLNTLLKS